MDSDRIARVGAVALFVTVALLYGALALAGWVWDDTPLIVQNRITGDLGNLPRFFLEDLWASSGGDGHQSGYYRPLMLTSLAVDRALWGLSPAGHHLHSVAWHLAASGLLLALLRTLVAPLPALLGTAVFALHPLQSEAVAWVSSRNDPMVATFVVAAVLALAPERCSPRRLVAGGLLVLAATLSKESGVLAPVLLLALDLGRWRRVGDLRRYGVAAAALLIWFGLRTAAGVSLDELPASAGVPMLLERGHLVVSKYGQLLLVPWPLSTGRTLEYLRDPAWLVAGGLAVVVGLAVLQVRRGEGLGVAGLAFTLVAAAPSMVAIADKGQIGERYLYLPLVGLALGLAAALPARSRWLWLALPVAVGWTAALHLRLPQWQNALDLWAAAAESTPNGYALTGYAHELNRAERYEEAQRTFLAAVQDAPPMDDACANVLRGPLKRGEHARALENSRLLKGKGCAATPAFMAIVSTVLARNCLWDEVRTTVTRAPGDAAQRDRVLLGALALQDGAVDAYDAFGQSYRGGTEAWREAVQQALDLGCRADLVAPG